MSGLLVSVRNVLEAHAALAGGASLIDIKEPSHGALGRADDETILAILDEVADRVPVSAAMGELIDHVRPCPHADRLTFQKWGLAGMLGEPWRDQVRRLRDSSRLVLCAYADAERAGAPVVADLCRFAIEERLSGLLIDTWEKDGSTLLDWLDPRPIVSLCREAGVPIALAGSLHAKSLLELRDCAPDWFAVRGAVCEGGREGTVSAHRVATLVEILRG